MVPPISWCAVTDDQHAPQTSSDTPTGAGTPATLVVWAITAINVVVWLAMEAYGGSASGRTLIAFGAKVNPLIADGEYWRLVAPIFLHIGLMHLVFNSIALLTFGRLAEIIFGHTRFLAIYLVSGVAGTVLSYLLSRGVSAGASGAIFGLGGALAVFFAVNRGAGPAGLRGQLGSMVVLLAINGGYGLVQPAVDNWGHAGGLIGGLALAAWLAPRVAPVVNPDGLRIGWRLRSASAAAWAIVPVVLGILAVAVARFPGR